MTRVAEATEAKDRTGEADVVVLREPDAAQLEREFGDCPIVVVSGARTVAAALSRRRIAWALLPQSATSSDVDAAVRLVARGLTVQPAAIAGTVTGVAGSGTKQAGPVGEPQIEPLTPRELDVLQQLAEGLSNHAIAGTLGISDHTVKFHLASIFGKLGAGTRTEAVRRGLRRGLVTV